MCYLPFNLLQFHLCSTGGVGVLPGAATGGTFGGPGEFLVYNGKQWLKDELLKCGKEHTIENTTSSPVCLVLFLCFQCVIQIGQT